MAAKARKSLIKRKNFANNIMKRGKEYVFDQAKARTTARLRRGSRRGKQFIWRRRGDVSRAVITKNGFRRKERARHGDIINTADIVIFLFLLRVGRLQRFHRFNTRIAGRNVRRLGRRSAIRQAQRPNGEYRIRVAANRRRVVLVFLLTNVPLDQVLVCSTHF